MLLVDGSIGGESSLFSTVSKHLSEAGNSITEVDFEFFGSLEELLAESVVGNLVDPLELLLEGPSEGFLLLSNGFFKVFPCGTEDHSERFSLGGSSVSKIGSQGVDDTVQVSSLAGELSLELLTSSGKAALRSFSGSGKDEIELGSGILDSGGESFLGLVDGLEDLLLIS